MLFRSRRGKEDGLDYLLLNGLREMNEPEFSFNLNSVLTCQIRSNPRAIHKPVFMELPIPIVVQHHEYIFSSV
jgi:hypothetical protein